MSQASALMTTYAQLPIAFAYGKGVWLYDEQGRRYLDALSGIAVNTLGHAHAGLVAALSDQINKIIHSSNLFRIPLQHEVASFLTRISGMDNAFFCNSGLEANEAAIKIARLYGHNRGIDRPEIVVYEKAFHGRSLATLSATGNEKVQKGFEPLVEGFVRAPLNDLGAIEQIARDRPKVCAIFIEAIQGEGGINPARLDYLKGLRQICDSQGWLLMIDEVQCGLGRTGRWFAHQWAEIVPDVMPLAKGLASGVPVGAVVARGVAAETFKPGNHGTTFGGNPLAMRAALTTLQTIENEGLLEHVQRVGAYLHERLSDGLSGQQSVIDIRGRGLMLGIELDRPAGVLVKQGLEQGIVFNVTADTVVRLLPPLIFDQRDVDYLLERLLPLIRQHLQANH